MNIRSITKNFASLEQCICTSSRTVDVILLTKVNMSVALSSVYQITPHYIYIYIYGFIIFVNEMHKFQINKFKTQH